MSFGLHLMKSESFDAMGLQENLLRGIYAYGVEIYTLPNVWYLNLVDWSSHNVLVVGLGNCLYLWNACSGKVSSHG
jgi:hypothetical protein